MCYKSEGTLINLLFLPQSTRLYDTVNNHMRAKFDHQDAVLDCSFITATTAIAGGMDGQLKMFDFNTHSDRVIGYHQDAIKCVEWNSEVNLAVTGRVFQIVFELNVYIISNKSKCFLSTY